MATCSHCKAEIDHLKVWVTQEALFTFALDENGEPTENESLDFEETKRDYECPACNEKIFSQGEEEEAIEFLKGGEKPE